MADKTSYPAKPKFPSFEDVSSSDITQKELQLPFKPPSYVKPKFPSFEDVGYAKKPIVSPTPKPRYALPSQKGRAVESKDSSGGFPTIETSKKELEKLKQEIKTVENEIGNLSAKEEIAKAAMLGWEGAGKSMSGLIKPTAAKSATIPPAKQPVLSGLEALGYRKIEPPPVTQKTLEQFKKVAGGKGWKVDKLKEKKKAKYFIEEAKTPPVGFKEKVVGLVKTAGKSALYPLELLEKTTEAIGKKILPKEIQKEAEEFKKKIAPKKTILDLTPREEFTLSPVAKAAASLIGSAPPYVKAFKGIEAGYNTLRWFRTLTPATKRFITNATLLSAAQGLDEQSFEGAMKGYVMAAGIEGALLAAGIPAGAFKNVWKSQKAAHVTASNETIRQEAVSKIRDLNKVKVRTPAQEAEMTWLRNNLSAPENLWTWSKGWKKVPITDIPVTPQKAKPVPVLPVLPTEKPITAPIAKPIIEIVKPVIVPPMEVKPTTATTPIHLEPERKSKILIDNVGNDSKDFAEKYFNWISGHGGKKPEVITQKQGKIAYLFKLFYSNWKDEVQLEQLTERGKANLFYNKTEPIFKPDTNPNEFLESIYRFTKPELVEVKLPEITKPVEVAKPESKTFYRFGDFSVNKKLGIINVAETPEIAMQYSDAGILPGFQEGKKLIKIKTEGLNILDIRKLSENEQFEIMGKDLLGYKEPDGLISWEALEYDPKIYRKLSSLGYDGIKVSAGDYGEHVAIFEEALTSKSFKPEPVQAEPVTTPIYTLPGKKRKGGFRKVAWNEKSTAKKVMELGGISPTQGKYNVEDEIIQAGMKRLINKKRGQAIESLADTLEQNGDISVKSEENPGDALIRILQEEEKSGVNNFRTLEEYYNAKTNAEFEKFRESEEYETRKSELSEAEKHYEDSYSTQTPEQLQKEWDKLKTIKEGDLEFIDLDAEIPIEPSAPKKVSGRIDQTPSGYVVRTAEYESGTFPTLNEAVKDANQRGISYEIPKERELGKQPKVDEGLFAPEPEAEMFPEKKVPTGEPISKDVQDAINEVKMEGERGGILKPELGKIMERTKHIAGRIKYALQPLSEQLPPDAYNRILQLNKELGKNIEDVQLMVGEKATYPWVTKVLTKIYPWASPSGIQNATKTLRNLPMFGRWFGVSGNEMKLAFKLAESILEIDAKGNPIFGTLKKTGEVRYTPEEGLAMWNAARNPVRKMVSEFAKPLVDAKDIFNRNLAKQVFGIETDLQGYVRHMGFEGRPIDKFKRILLSFRKASPKKLRTEAIGFREQFEEATSEGLLNLLNTKSYNEFVVKFEEALTEPITKNNPLKDGWAKVTGKFGSNKDIELQTPNAVYDEYIRYTEPAKDVSEIGSIVNGLGNYYKANLLLHPGTTVTNLIGQEVLFATKLLDDFYGQALLGGNFSPLKNDIRAIFNSLSPSMVKKTPSYLWGESQQVSSFIGETQGIGAGLMSKLLIPFKSIDTYAKRMVYMAETAEKMGYENFKKATTDDLFNLKDSIKNEVDAAIDLYALNYVNIPKGLGEFRKTPGSFLIAPFPTYYYKYGQHVAHYLQALNPAVKMPTQDRATRIMTLMTLMSISAYIDNRLEQKSGEYISPKRGVTSGMAYQFEKSGRVKIGETAEGEEYLRVAKYPWISVYEAGMGLTEMAMNKKELGVSRIKQLQEESITFGLGINAFDVITGRRTKYELYKPADVKMGEMAKTFIPGFRITEGIKKIRQPEKVRPRTALEALAAGLPFGELKGAAVKKGITRYNPREELLKLLYGINIRTIDPEEFRKERNKVIRNMIKRLHNKKDLDEQQIEDIEAALKVLKPSLDSLGRR